VREKVVAALGAPPSCAKPVPLPRTRIFPESARGTIAINSVSRTRKRQRPRLYWDDGWNYWGVLPHTTHTLATLLEGTTATIFHRSTFLSWPLWWAEQSDPSPASSIASRNFHRYATLGGISSHLQYMSDRKSPMCGLY
jgi:hypothetical protein